MKEELKAFDRLLTIMDELREKCPWDKIQTIESLRTLTIEETYELADAIIENNMKDIKKELGDILLHIVFYAKIAKEKKACGRNHCNLWPRFGNVPLGRYFICARFGEKMESTFDSCKPYGGTCTFCIRKK